MVVENKIDAVEDDQPKQIFGLSGEMSLGAAGKRAQQRLKKKMKEEEKQNQEQ